MTDNFKKKNPYYDGGTFCFLTFLDQLTKKIASMYLIGNDITIIPNILECIIWKIKELPGGFFKIAPGFSEVFPY